MSNEARSIFGGNCQKKQPEHSVRFVSSAICGHGHGSSKQNMKKRLGHIGLYARMLLGCFPLTELSVEEEGSMNAESSRERDSHLNDENIEIICLSSKSEQYLSNEGIEESFENEDFILVG
ncbi:hypothetical protein TNCV_4189701 [Trichonephila clavipes]|nr:hypothetical protein TNCV_4189701 [Trichonephila clavipes]